MWDTDSYSKTMHEAPWDDPMMLDWVRQYGNGTYYHYAEPMHAIPALAKEAKSIISNHFESRSSNPMFLYVPFTSAHGPLQPLPEHIAKCEHISQLWRKQYCGMVVGLDEAIKNITEHALKLLGENTIIIITSDNGGSPWFGGMNYPLRGSKITPLEGGVRVPGIISELSKNQKYLLSNEVKASAAAAVKAQENSKETTISARKYYGLMHFSDWFPTLLSFAGVSSDQLPKGLDGYDMSKQLSLVPFTTTPVSEEKETELEALVRESKTAYSESPRKEVLLEMYYANESVFKQEMVSYRIGDYKLVRGILRDTNYYYESSGWFLNMSNPSIFARAFETLHHFVEAFLVSEGAYDAYRIAFTHGFMQTPLTLPQRLGKEETYRLYNIKEDPSESKNLYYEESSAAIIQQIEERIEYYRLSRLPPQKPWLVYHWWDVWGKTHVKGDCSMNPEIPEHLCRFAHPWIDDVSFIFLLFLTCCYCSCVSCFLSFLLSYRVLILGIQVFHWFKQKYISRTDLEQLFVISMVFLLSSLVSYGFFVVFIIIMIQLIKNMKKSRVLFEPLEHHPLILKRIVTI
jgi:hypothetical protein